MPTPFVYGRPVKGNEFLGRETELSTIFHRLENGDSTAVVGEPHIGKTSLLLQIANPAVQTAFLGENNSNFLYSYIDLLPAGFTYNQKEFWGYALQPLKEKWNDNDIKRQFQLSVQEEYSYRSLERLFRVLDHKGLKLVLLLDEFDRLLSHVNFRDASFFACLRSLSTQVGGISFVMATRATVAQLDEVGRGIMNSGSPLFNNLIQLTLKPFDDTEFVNLLSRAGDIITPAERKYIRRIAGKHPFLLQAFAAVVYENRHEKPAAMAEIFYDQISHHFDDLWYVLDDTTRTVAVILSVMDLGGRALGQEFSFGEIENVQAFGPELKKLAMRGMAERVGVGWEFDAGNFLLWRGERWTSGSQAFTWWVRDAVISGARSVPSCDQWLRDKRYTVLVTQEMWDRLFAVARLLPDWATKGIGSLAGSLFDQLVHNVKTSS